MEKYIYITQRIYIVPQNTSFCIKRIEVLHDIKVISSLKFYYTYNLSTPYI